MKKIIWFLLVFILVGCGSQTEPLNETGQTEQPDEIVLIKAVTLGEEPDCGMDAVYEELDKLTSEELGCILRFDFVPWKDAKSQIERLIALKEHDLYCVGAFMDFEGYVQKHAFADMGAYLEDYPQLLVHYTKRGKNLLDAGRWKDTLYGIPQIVRNGESGNGFFYREDLREAWDLPKIKDFETLEAYLYRSAEEYPDVSMINDKRFFQVIEELFFKNKYVRIGNHCVVDRQNPTKLLALYDLKEYQEMLSIAKKWYDDGIVANDILGFQENSTDETKRLMLQDKKPLEFSNHLQAVSSFYIPELSERYPDQRFGWFAFNIYDNNCYQDIYHAGVAMAAVSSSCSRPDLAMRLLELAHTDQRYYDLLTYGADGTHYHLTEDGKISYQGISEENRFAGWTAIRDSYMQREMDVPDYWSKILRENREAFDEIAGKNGHDILEGFSLETPDMAEEIETAYEQYMAVLEMGISDHLEADYKAARQKLDEAGFSAYLLNIQKQLNRYFLKKES